MIEPISLKMTSEQLVIHTAISHGRDIIGNKYPVEACLIDSGRLKGSTVAYVRYLTTAPGDDGLYLWQVIKKRAPDHNQHYSTVETLEQALHLVMACAYEYVAFN